MDDSDIKGLPLNDAKAYLMDFLTALKLLEKELSSVAQEVSAWAGRAELASAKGAPDLEGAARAKLAEYQTKLDSLEAEKQELTYKIKRIKEQLPLLAASEKSIDPDLLLARLRMAAGMDPDDRNDQLNADNLGQGNEDILKRDISSLGADDALSALKKKISEES